MSDWPPPPAEHGWAFLRRDRPEMPTVAIVVSLEDEPRVVVTTHEGRHEQDWRRLHDWVEQLPEEWRELFERAFELDREARSS